MHVTDALGSEITVGDFVLTAGFDGDGEPTLLPAYVSDVEDHGDTAVLTIRVWEQEVPRVVRTTSVWPERMVRLPRWAMSPVIERLLED